MFYFITKSAGNQTKTPSSFWEVLLRAGFLPDQTAPDEDVMELSARLLAQNAEAYKVLAE